MMLPQHRSAATPAAPGPDFFKILLEQLDADEMAPHSAINHHVDGLNYLCLSRTDKLTIKLYLMERPRNDNDGYLVNPHSHRYAFSSIVLSGMLQHFRFGPLLAPDGRRWRNHFEYSAESKRLALMGAVQFVEDAEFCPVGTRYFVSPSEIHTLRVYEHEPLLLGLVQFSDERAVSDLYLPSGAGDMTLPQTRQPATGEVDALRVRALQLLAEAAQ